MSRLKLKRCRELIALGCLWFAAAVLAGCASDGNIAAGTAGGTRATVCKSGDQPVASASQCLQDDAACYTLADGSFCTGPRGNAADLPDLAGKEVVVVTENAYPPLQFVDPKTGDAIGWEYDAMNELAARLNFKLVIENASWDAMIPAVSEDQFDVGMTGITIKEDRKEKVDFSDAYMRSEMFMLVRADEDRFSDGPSFAAFTDGLVGAQAGTTPFYVAVYDMLDGDEANPRIKLLETFGAAVQALRVGDVDVVLTDGTAGQGYVDANPNVFKLTGDSMGTEDFGFIFPKGSEGFWTTNWATEFLRVQFLLTRECRGMENQASSSCNTCSRLSLVACRCLTDRRMAGLSHLCG